MDILTDTAPSVVLRLLTPVGVVDGRMRQRFASSRRVCRAHGWPRRRHVGTGFPISFCFRGARRIARGGLARPLGLCRLSFDQKRTELTPGTVLVRDWDR